MNSDRGQVDYLNSIKFLNSIELCFAKLKTIVRAARCRNIETLWPLLGECLQRFSPDECRNYFRHAGYSGAERS